MPELMKLTASLEDYIEAIYHIVEKKQVARGKDIASRLGVSRASVTEALRSLSKKGLINYAPYEVITMTDTGREIAEDVIHRHSTLKRFFMEVLALDEKISESGACKIEHAASPEIISRMINFIDFLEECPRGGEDLIKGFADFCDKGGKAADCNLCVAKCLDHKATATSIAGSD